ncbi:hypothetical protein O9G_004026 [Rozella allomycis CSF55]|uniref:RIIa domain-containing protein n=1 Tax=Rozella allomycis (strain CSF55) TaxID=988480 RepID=A0A075AX51_ROZAC|nr:hypothetical protein O9G_004026 [Rozella allomycis CSF55]|eukprot:EPZ34719.1 hypothetical protein O9G_004026 [Rozella allomycis CSF55]
MSVNESIYTAEQIRIPSEFPDILKNYAKSVLKDQPNDVYTYSIEYFQNVQKSRPSLKKLSDSQLWALYQKMAKLCNNDEGTLSKTDVVALYDVIGASNQHVQEIIK